MTILSSKTSRVNRKTDLSLTSLKLARDVVAILLGSGFAPAYSGPAGMTVGQGQATVSGTEQSRRIEVSDRTLLNWQSFNIGAGESLTFVQPSASSVVWNRILDANPSSIYGRLEGNGIVVLQNSSGFYFGPNSFVSAAGLFITTSPSLPPDFAPGGSWIFNGPPPTASIVNYGELRTQSGGSLFLVAERIENHGTLAAPEGKIGLLAGQEVLVSERPDGRGLSAEVRIPSGLVDNQGHILADAGQVALHARVVNQGGVIEANSIQERNGVIELVATEAINLGSQSHIEARGRDGEGADGGKVSIISERLFSDEAGSRIDVSGGELGGRGGFLEISGKQISTIQSTFIGSRPGAAVGASLRLAASSFFIGASPGGGDSGSGDPLATLHLDETKSFVGFSRVTLAAEQDITLGTSTTWDLSESTGRADPGSVLALRAGRDITLQSESLISAGDKWSMDLAAGVSFQGGATPIAGVGKITMLGSAGLQAKDGSLVLRAGRDVTVKSGFIRTVGGGNIAVTAIAGSVDSGNKTVGFQFGSSGGYDANLAELGGISTGAGGDVSITAGQDISSFLPNGTSSSHTDGGSGAFGGDRGNVTLVAGRDIIGHYVLRNGMGSISAGRDAGTDTRLLALSLAKGSWDVTAGHDLLLQEVRNPNGIFNNRPFISSNRRHQFDYDANAAVHLSAAHSVQLLGSKLPRNVSEAIPPIYAPTLTVDAGAGGVVLGNKLFLYPSASGQLEIRTTEGGSFRSAVEGTIYELSMSDSSRSRWTSVFDFGPNDSLKTRLHENDPLAAEIHISGNVRDLSLAVPKPTRMTVGGDVKNTSFVGQNFKDSDITSIEVSGDIWNRNDWTFKEGLTSRPNFDSLINAVEPENSIVNFGVLRGKFVYNEQLHRLGFHGRMSGAELAALLSLRVKTFDSSGKPIRNANGEFVTVPGTFVDAETLRDMALRTADVPDQAAQGYQLGGPGLFRISARNLDLGITEGIVSHGPGLNSSLATLSARGADIDVKLRGNLSMFSSSIQSRAGGDISVVSDGNIDVGSQEILGSSEIARGIYTAREGDVTVIAKGNIKVNGSRIAAYSGGNVLVRSLDGNVDAGEGGVGFVRVARVLANTASGEVQVKTRGIPGSGILATTIPGTDDSVGNITVETPKGDILAGQGGIAQLSFNGTPNRDGVVKLSAGTPRGAHGEPEIEGSIRAGNSGVIGGNVNLRATGDIEGVVVAQRNLDIVTTRNVNVTALAGGNVNVAASGTVSGTIAAAGSVDAAGGSIDASLISANVSASSGSGNLPSSSSGAANSAASQAAAATSEKAASAAAEEKDEEKPKRKAALPTLARMQGRVTVVLPGR